MKTQLAPFCPELAAVLGTDTSQNSYISISASAKARTCFQAPIKHQCDTDTALARIEAALLRLDSGTFGLCVRCGDEISLTRLDDDPAASRCQDCSGH